MSDPMDIDENSVGEQSAVPMSISDDGQNLKRQCLPCAVDAGQPGKQPCERPPEEGAAGQPRSKFEDLLARIDHELKTQEKMIEDWERRYGQQPPADLSVHIKCTKYRHELMEIYSSAIKQYINNDKFLHGNGDRALPLWKREKSNGELEIFIGDESSEDYTKFAVDLDDKPSFHEFKSYGKKPKKKFPAKKSKKGRTRPPKTDDPGSSSA
ncbi:hypothetical protein MY3296_009736 [Beauveria thailandica]